MTTRSDRAGMIRKLHVAKRQLALADDSYRAILMRITGKDSSAKMGASELDAVLREFRRIGFRPTSTPSAEPQVRMVFGLWTEMEPILRNPSRAALRSFCLKVTGVDDPNFLTSAQANKLIEALKAWGQRERRRQKEAADAG